MEPERRAVAMPVWLKSFITFSVSWWAVQTPAVKTALLVGTLCGILVGVLLV